MSKKETRRIYCDEEELAYAKHCIQQRRAGLVLQNTDSALNGSLEDKLGQILDYISDLKSEVYTLRSYTIPQLEHKISALTHKVEQLSGQSY